MISYILTYFIWFLVWILLTWPPTPKNLITGLVAAYLVSLFKMDIFRSPENKSRPGAEKNKGPASYIKKIPWFLYYVVVLLYECVKANIDVAFRVMHPDVPVRPGTVKVRTGLKSDAGLTFLANSVTLTSGAATVDVNREKGCLYVHLLYIKDGLDASAVNIPAINKFEKILENIFE